MRTTLLAATAMMLALPAAAQQSQVPNNIVDPRTPQEVQQHIQFFQQNPNAAVPGGPNTQGGSSGGLSQADAAELRRSIGRLLTQANQALSRGNWNQATDLLERAETSLLNIHSAPGVGTREAGMQEGRALRAVNEARTAAASRNRRGATEALQTAQAETSRIGESSLAGSTGGMQQGMQQGMQGGMAPHGMATPGMGTQPGMMRPGASAQSDLIAPGMGNSTTMPGGLIAPGMGTTRPGSAQPGMVQPGMGSGMNTPGMPAQGMGTGAIR
ncbi:MAG TPA: hypothetical protein VE033_14740 [Acetobacteraceae bacterium]|jgi:hypothetical protein|nr:hypothetical protein [Acetobacteraceae bacterium]